jgi:hypothetical protein
MLIFNDVGTMHEAVEDGCGQFIIAGQRMLLLVLMMIAPRPYDN